MTNDLDSRGSYVCLFFYDMWRGRPNTTSSTFAVVKSIGALGVCGCWPERPGSKCVSVNGRGRGRERDRQDDRQTYREGENIDRERGSQG